MNCDMVIQLEQNQTKGITNHLHEPAQMEIELQNIGHNSLKS